MRWERLGDRRLCRVVCYTTGSLEDAVEQQVQHRKWAVDRLLCFKKVYCSRLAALAKTGAV